VQKCQILKTSWNIIKNLSQAGGRSARSTRRKAAAGDRIKQLAIINGHKIDISNRRTTLNTLLDQEEPAAEEMD